MSNDNQMENDPYAIFQAGDKVRHPKFGEGQIIQRSGTGDHTKFVVKFVEEGEKRLLASLAKLKRIQPMTADEKSERQRVAEEKARKAVVVPHEKEVDEIEEEALGSDEGEEALEEDADFELDSDNDDLDEPAEEDDDRFEN
jgi:hypothetical protein